MLQGTLAPLIPSFEELAAATDASALVLDRYLSSLKERRLEPYPAQEEAILALWSGENVILNTPTGSGKSLVAEALAFAAVSFGKRIVLTFPIKALVNEKFLDLCRLFGAESVGLSTGDATVNREAPILCCTAEILAQKAAAEGERLAIDDVVMDEFHYYGDRDRGVAWQLPLLTLSQTRFLLMSATLGPMESMAEKLTELNERPTQIISGGERPVPLEFDYRGETHLHETIKDLLGRGWAPIYLVGFTQNSAHEEAQNLMSIDILSKDEKAAILSEIKDFRFASPLGKELSRHIRHGVGIHHAGLLPRYRRLVEKLAQKGLLKVICGTDTLGVGINVPIRTVLFTKLCKFDGQKVSILSARDFHQIAGRAGRRGYDTLGYVVAQAPEHVIENIKLERKAASDPKKAKKLVRAKPPERGFVNWTEESFRKLVAAQPEPLVARFQVDHALLLRVLGRGEEGCSGMRSLIRKAHVSAGEKKQWFKHSWVLLRSLIERKIIGFENGRMRVNVELQEDFSLHHATSLWLIDALGVLDPQSETYSLDVVSLIECVLENPEVILRRQTDRARSVLYQELRAQGVEYEERQEKLEEVSYPKPMAEFAYESFRIFSENHPWVSGHTVQPKSIAREMIETGAGFADTIRDYDLKRAEGLLLRYLGDFLRVLVRTVPESFKSDGLRDIEAHFRVLVRGVDRSLLSEWEGLRDGVAPADLSTGEIGSVPVVIDEKALLRECRNEAFRLLRALATEDYEAAIDVLTDWGDANWTAAALEAQVSEYKELGHGRMRTDPAARAGHLSRLILLSELDEGYGEGFRYRFELRVLDEKGVDDGEIAILLRPLELKFQLLRFFTI